jgi:hypothetical protein
MVLGFMRTIKFQVQGRASFKPLFEAIPNPSSRPILRFRLQQKNIEVANSMNKETRNKSQIRGLPCLMQTYFEKLLLPSYFLAFIFLE